MNLNEFRHVQTRRIFLRETAAGLGLIALWHLMTSEGSAAAISQDLPNLNPLEPKAAHFAAKAKNVIFLFMAGGPSQLDLFDPKPELKKWEGRPLPESMVKGVKLAFVRPTANVWASPRSFKRYGQSGTELSDYLPHLASCVDDLCLVRSMYTDQVNHHPGQLMMNCGSSLGGRPAMGAWVTYGLGSESQNLPGFVVLSSGGGTSAGSGNWSCGFLPSTFQGVPFRSTGDPVLHLSSPEGVTRQAQRSMLDALRDLNQQRYFEMGDLEIASRITSYELAFRMQAAGPELLDLSGESESTKNMYGLNDELKRPFATNCLLARRMVERGVRFVQLFHEGWDNHSDLNPQLKKQCDITDQPTAALLKDLKQRGLLDSTLVIWGGEFGRTAMVENRKPGQENSLGRDHHGLAFSMWVAGGGIKGGQVVGRTDDFGFNIVEDRIEVHDLHATILHCLGLEHERLTFRHQGRDFRLTDVGGQVVNKLLS